MYQLSSRPQLVPISSLQKGSAFVSPQILREARTLKEDHVLVDRYNTIQRVFPGASKALSEIQRWRQEGHNEVYAAVSSRTDEPSWARYCMEQLVVLLDSEDDDNDDDPNSRSRPQTSTVCTLRDCFEDRVQISKANKARHIEALHRQTQIAYRDMCFFDNEYWNIQDVSSALPEVKAIYTPDGMTVEAWEEAKKHFNML